MRSNPVIDTQMNHVSVRFFKNETIPADILNTVVAAGRRAPTSSNLQTYSIVLVKDQNKKNELSILAGKQQHIIDCPVFIVFCADLHRSQKVCELHGQEMTNNLETFIISTIDASLVGMSVQTAAESFGLGAVMVGGIRNDLKGVAEILELPQGVYPVYGMSMGWPNSEKVPPQKPRLPRDLVIHEDTYSLKDLSNTIEQHDKEMAAHYHALGTNLSDAAWSGPVARNMSRPRRPDTHVILKELRFNIS